MTKLGKRLIKAAREGVAIACGELEPATYRVHHRQLNLFKGKNQRGVAPPAPKEFAMQCAVADLLRRFAKPTWQWTHIANGEERPAEYINGVRVSWAGARLKRAGVQPGWPDIFLLSPGGKPHCMELKRRKAKPSEHQAAFALWCGLNNVPHAFVDDVADAIKVLNQWGVLRNKIEAW